MKNTWNKWKIINEKAKAAINTPLPNAIIEEIIFFGKLTNNATTIDPISRGILAIKPPNQRV